MDSDINILYGQIRQGDAGKEKRLFQVLSEKFRYFALHRIWDRADAEEVVQNALMTIYGEFKTVEFTVSFAAWAYKVLDNKILDYIQTKKRRGLLMDRAIQNHRISQPTLSTENPELKRRLLSCLEKIGRSHIRYARILNLHYQGFTTSEICRKVNLTRNVFYTSLFRARLLLVSCLEDKDTVDE